jgi:thiol-disulfide isomerase/thioredoxin
MDRLSVVSALALVSVLGCEQTRAPHQGARERVNAVKANHEAAEPAAMCDSMAAPAKAPAFAWPKLAGAQPARAGGAWLWVNLWATWCAPCVEELPRLVEWRERLRRSGVAVDLALVSADASDALVDAFRRQHPGTPEGARLADPDDAIRWIASLGVSGATLPVHVLVDPAGRVRCVRVSALEDPDYPALVALLSR